MPFNDNDEFMGSSNSSASESMGSSDSYESTTFTTSTNTEQENKHVSSGGGLHLPENIGDWIQFFICLVFGAFGIHKFLEGKIGLGILYALTNGLFYIGWILDAIKYFRKASKLF